MFKRENSVSTLVKAFDDYRINGYQRQENLCLQLDILSKALANDQALRYNLTSEFPSIWTCISELWDALLLESLEERDPHRLALSLARFMRNLVAGVTNNQDAAFINEPKIRRILHHLTSFSQLEDRSTYALTRMLVQTISNLVTLNNDLTARLWILYTTLPEEQNVLTRLLASPDMGTVIATLVLILNCINIEVAHLARLTSPIGLRIIVQLLDRTEEWVEQADDESDKNEAFTITYRIFEALLKQDLGATLYHSLIIEDEPIAPHQITFLKILDSSFRNQAGVSHSTQSDLSFLPKSFLDLCMYSQHAIRRSLDLQPPSPHLADSPPPAQGSSRSDLTELDLRLPKVSAALILLSQCLTTICLEARSLREAGKWAQMNSGYDMVAVSTQAVGFAKNLVETLRLVDLFLPRIVFGKPVPTPRGGKIPEASPTELTGFNYLKRDLVRLLGTICHEQKETQDRIRECGGIPVVMNLCVIDERNPYLQEHAVFALHNLLHKNPENQAVVDAMKPESERT